MSSTDPSLETETHELEGDEQPELEMPDLPELPPDLRRALLDSFPPGNNKSSGFASSLVDLMTKADKYNLARLFEMFPVYGVAFMLWEEGMIEYSPDRRTVTIKEQHADAMSVFGISDWGERCRVLQNVISYSGTTHNGQILTRYDLAHALDFGAY